MKKSYVGQFLYNQFTKELFKYDLVDPDVLEFYFSEMLQQEVKRNETLHKDILEEDDYDKCRGRVFYFKDKGFTIAVGSWINEYKEAIDIICNIFNLDKSNTNILIHKHWDIDNNRDLD